MAYKRYNGNFKSYKKRNKTRRNGRSSKKRYSEVERAAYLYGQVQRGLDNPNSKITASFERGKKKPKKVVRKPLF